ncbi:MAG: FHA domain-containing protein [Planctomycetes bacterium]|nr:FHA domain-containing protein [Planctomycetota bacterium]
MASQSVQPEAPPLVGASAPRLRLSVQAGSHSGEAIACHRVVTTLGSRNGCKVVLRHPTVSPVHAAIVNTGSEILAVDLVTQNGTRLNGLKMEHERLSDGDLLEIHPWEFRVDIVPPLHGDDGQVHLFGLEPPPNVVGLEHLGTGKVLQPNREICIIGRRAGCDVTLEDDRVSRAHALMINYMGYPALFDLQSCYGTFVDDQRVGFHLLKDGEVLGFGDTRFRVHFVGSGVVEGAAPRRAAEPKDAAKNNGSHKVNGTNGVAAPAGPDLINIEAVDRAQRWDIAESLEKVSRRR